LVDGDACILPAASDSADCAFADYYFSASGRRSSPWLFDRERNRVAVLLTGSYAISDRRQCFAIALILSILSIITTALLGLYPMHSTVIVAHGCGIFLLGFFSVTILDYVVRSGRVTADKILAAICAYLLIGYAWAFAYAILDEFNPGAFATPTEVARNDYVGRVIQMRYFSFMTLATVGYGDIVPRTPAREPWRFSRQSLDNFISWP
jgi:hypothetical membrane protein